MAGLITSLHTGASGLYTSQTAVQVTGNNIANASTAGYSRQVASIVSTTPLTSGGLTYGSGSAVDAIDRAGDSFIVQQLVAQSAAYGAYQAASTPLADIERIIDIGDSGLAGDIDSFFDAWEELSTNPSGTAERQQVLQEAGNLADHFHQIDQQLTEVVYGINTSIESTVPDLNNQLSQIATLNQSIMQTELAGGDANTLRDQRDLLVQQVSETCGATISTDGNGMVCLQLQNGLPLVTGNVASSFATTKVDGLTQISLTSGTTSYALAHDDFSGTLGGLLTTRDVTIPQFQNDIDRLAYTLATDVNTLITTSGGIDQNGDAATDLFALTAPADPLADVWDGAAASISVAIDNVALLAAGTTGTTADNSLCLSIAALRDTTAIDGATYGEEYARIAAKAGLLVSNNEGRLTASSDTLDELSAKRDAIAGVSTDEEMILLIQYQAGYQAASNYLATVKEMLDILMQL
ncbi:flagellar hook-associated protein FlgK [Desulfobulbus elongatus]|uniref:flagellar hook-associated protein FlgK n=1 Tax=Desulfobulbus elongatus TaxID=53332 RepID=UPI000480FCA4|nr:flagellar hook-associated protein FlgK [Desulfobulbus elongatus]